MRTFLLKLMAFPLFLALFLELLFRTLVPAAEMPAGFQDQEHMIMALDRDSPLDGTHTLGRLGRPAFRWHINNYGFNSATDYRPAASRTKPCVAVIGDSYTQGLYSNVEDHLSGRLQMALGDSCEVYNLATSGMPFSQCAPVVRFAEAHFDPDLIIIQAGSSSLVRSLRTTGLVRYCQQYVVDGDTLKALPPTTFTVNKRNRLLRKSALVRYLYHNANLNLRGAGDIVKAMEDASENPDELHGVPRALCDSVLDKIFAEIAVASPGTPVLVVFDANRNALYGSATRPPRLAESPVVEAGCRRNGIHFLDLTDAFWDEYGRTGRRFDFSNNYHWNPYGVEVVARAIHGELGVFARTARSDSTAISWLRY